jgi:hypothetical protein
VSRVYTLDIFDQFARATWFAHKNMLNLFLNSQNIYFPFVAWIKQLFTANLMLKIEIRS